MRKTVILSLLLGSLVCAASDPELSITGKDSYNGFATVAGIVEAQGLSDVRITVRCGNTTYTTLPDSEGRWAVVFRHTNFNFYVNAWDVKHPGRPIVSLRASLTLGGGLD